MAKKWPESWIAIEGLMEASAFQEALQRELVAGHPLFGMPLRAVARRWDDIHVLFAFEDGSERFVMALLGWRRKPLEPLLQTDGPAYRIYESFEEWSRDAELLLKLARFRSKKALNAKFKSGDKVLLLKGGEWEFDVRATIAREGRTRMIYDGTIHIGYFVDFDVPQASLHDEPDGGPTVKYEGTSVLENQLRPLGQRNPS
jgi:hypothetical protein